MDFERLKFIAAHPLKVYDQHRVKEIRRFRKFGKDPETVYYVIRCDLEGCGLFAIFMYWIILRMRQIEDMFRYWTVKDIIGCIRKKKK